MEKTQLNHENGIHPTMLSKWKREYRENPGTAFSGNLHYSMHVDYWKFLDKIYSKLGYISDDLTYLKIQLVKWCHEVRLCLNDNIIIIIFYFDN